MGINQETLTMTEAEQIAVRNTNSAYLNSDKLSLPAVQTAVVAGLSEFASATPLIASSTEEMTDTTRIYVNTTDGYLYAYSDSAWASTGVLYQATGVADGQIEAIVVDACASPLTKTDTGNPVSIYPVANSKLSLVADITATQSGSGTPSPDNVRALTGHAAVTLSNNATDYTITPTTTLYGFTGGEDKITITSAGAVYAEHNTAKWVLNGSQTMFYSANSDDILQFHSANLGAYLNSEEITIISSHFNAVTYSSLGYTADSIAINGGNSRIYFNITATRIGTTVEASAADKQAALATWLAANPVTVIYRIATPVVDTLAAQVITAVSGENEISSTGIGDIAVTYNANLTTSVTEFLSEYAQLLTQISEVNGIGKITELQTPVYNLETGVYTVDEGGTLLLGDGGEELEYGIVFVSNEAALKTINFLAIGRDNAYISAIFRGNAVLNDDVWRDATYSILPQHAENADNRVTSVSNESTDEQYPSAKALYNFKLSDANFTGNTIHGIALRSGSVNGNRIETGTMYSTKIHADSLGKTISSASTDAHLATGKAVYTYAQPKSLYFNEVSASSWTSDTTYAGYGYKCEISLTGVTAAMVPYITLGHTEAVSGNYSPVALSGTGTITIYSKVNTSITIPLIKAEVV